MQVRYRAALRPEIFLGKCPAIGVATSRNFARQVPRYQRGYLPNNWGGKCSTKWAEFETNNTLLRFPATSYITTPVTSLIFAKVNSLANFTNSLIK
jgi:hypothetical protein